MSSSAVNKSFEELCERVREAKDARGPIIGEVVEVTEEIEKWYKEYGMDAVSESSIRYLRFG